MKRFLEKKYVNTGFIIALLILLSINVLTYLNTTVHFQDEKYQTLALETIQTSESFLGMLTQAETSRRGYLITNNEIFLSEYQDALVELDSSFHTLKKLSADDDFEVKTLDTLSLLLHNRKDLLKESLELQEEKKANMKGQIEMTNRGKETQDKIKRLIENIQARETEILKQRFADTDISSKYAITNLIVGTFVAFVLLILSVTLLNRNINQRKAFERELEESRNWLYTTLSSIGDAVIVTNSLGEIMFMNDMATSLTGWEEQLAMNEYIEHVYNVVDEETSSKAENPVIHSLKTGKVINPEKDVFLVSKDGREIPVDQNASPIKDNDLKIVGVVLVFRDVTVKRKAEHDLRNSQRFVQRIAETVPSILYIYDLPEPAIVYANHKISEILGFSEDEIMKMGNGFFARYVHPEDLKRLYLIYKRFARANDNEILDYEYRIMNSKSEWRWMHSYDVVFKRSPEGVAIQMLGSAQDVTERKKLEQELTKYSGHLEELVDNRTGELKLTNERLKQEIKERARAEKGTIEAEEKFRSLVEHSLAGIYILQDNKYVYVNPRFEEIFGYSKEEMESIEPENLVSEGDKEQVRESVESLFSRISLSVQYTYKAIRKDKRIIDVEVRAAVIDYDGRQALIGTLQDITERKQSEDEIRKQQEFLRTVIDLSPNLIFAKDWEGRFTLANKAVAEIYGSSPGELIGRTDADFNMNTEEVKQFIEADREVISRMKEKVVPEEMVSNSKTGETKWFQTIKIPLVSAAGQKQVLGVSSDITARKLAEELTKKSLKEKELLLQEIHHRVKNNLQIIVSLLKLQARYIFDERDLEIFNNSRSRVETMSLIHEKLNKSKDISRIDFESYIKDLAAYLIKAYKVYQENIELSVSAAGIYLGIDTAIPCGLIINELIINTLKYAFPEVKKGKISISVEQSNDEVQLTVADDGIGLPENFNIKESDSLGLQLVDTLIRQLNGSVHVDNSKGTSYMIRFKEVKYKERI